MSNILGSGDTAGRSAGPVASTEDGLRTLEIYREAPEAAIDRARLYSLLSLGFARPDEELQTLLSNDAFGSELCDAAQGLDDEDLLAAANAVSETAARRDDETLAYEWGSLFGVEEGVTVSPYELTYLPGPLLTTTRDLADIAGFYEAFGLSIADEENDRADHLIFQTEFLSELALREARLKMDEDSEGIDIVVDARRAFVESHLGRWYWRFADEVNKHDDGFYADLANLLAALVELEVDRLGVDPDWVPDHPEVIEWTEDIFGDSGRGCGGCGVGDEDIEDELGTGLSGSVPKGPE